MGRTVAVFGGGVGGLSVAHELTERGYTVTVYERLSEIGGKSRTIGAPGTAVGDGLPLPGEHGFRFFPHFYRHLPDTMARIPDGRGGVVADHLVATEGFRLSRQGAEDLRIPVGLEATMRDVGGFLVGLWRSDLGLSWTDVLELTRVLGVLLTSCDDRRHDDWDRMPWWDFCGAAGRGAGYTTVVADLTRVLVAAQAREISARTAGVTLLQLLFATTDPDSRQDRVLDGPTSEVWIEPWRAHLLAAGVTFEVGVELTGFDVDPGGSRVAAARVATGGGLSLVTADHYVAAVPCERLAPVLDPAMLAAAPSLAGVAALTTGWMVGAQFFLDRDVPMVHGHTLYLGSPWALTSISQRQFWPDVDMSRYGAGDVDGILSVDVSEWDTPGVLTGLPARKCSRDEIRDEIWAQIAGYVNDTDDELDPADVVGFLLDPAIRHTGRGATLQTTNEEPLLLNTPGSWDQRPAASCELDNLFLAADFVRTHTDLATMEGANEAARRAANAVLEADGLPVDVAVWRLREPAVFGPARAVDQWRYDRGLPHLCHS